MAGKLRYETVEAFDAAIEAYFKKCEGEVLMDADGKPVFDKYGQPVMIGVMPPTITGLALALGFTSREGFLAYKYRKPFSDSYSRARARCEAYAESRLFDRDGARGAQFALQYCYGWRMDAEEQNQKQEASGLTRALQNAAKNGMGADDSDLLPEDGGDETG